MKKFEIKIENGLIKIIGIDFKFVYDIDSQLSELYFHNSNTTTEYSIEITKLCNCLSKQIVICLKLKK
jgi:hypothetical protein